MTRPTAFTLPGLTAGLVVVLGLGCGILLGSRNLRNYDPTLLIYTFGALFSAFAITYRYTVWLQRPPTRMYWRRGWQLLLQRQEVGRHLLTLAGAFVSNFMAQHFIRRRGRSRWLAHFCMSWGTILAGAVTFPLVFGWIHFESQANAPQVYQILVFGIRIGAFHTEISWIRYVFFNLLNLAAVLVIVGVGLTLHRRLKDSWGSRCAAVWQRPGAVALAPGGLGDWPDADLQYACLARRWLRRDLADPRWHGHCHAPLPAIREALPSLATPPAPRGDVIQAGQYHRPAGRLSPLWRGFCRCDARRGSQGCADGGGVRLAYARASGALHARVSALPPPAGRDMARHGPWRRQGCLLSPLPLGEG